MINIFGYLAKRGMIHLPTDTTIGTEKIIVQKIMWAFRLFKRSPWHHRSIEGYKPSEIRMLLCIQKGIQHAPFEMKVSDISKLLQVTAPTVTQLIKGLEAEGLVERNIASTDRRAVGIKLTARGEMITQKAHEDFVTILNGLVDYLGEEQSNQLVELLNSASTYFSTCVSADPAHGPQCPANPFITKAEESLAPSYQGSLAEPASTQSNEEGSQPSHCGDTQA